jgi:hypothetical protein
MKLRRVSMMCRGRGMVPCCCLARGHADTLSQLIAASTT